MLYHAVTLSVIATGLAVQELVVRWTMCFVNCPSVGTNGVIESLRSKLDPKLNSPTCLIKSKLWLHAHYLGTISIDITLS
jgi:hypothetical protein